MISVLSSDEIEANAISSTFCGLFFFPIKLFCLIVYQDM